MDQIKLANPKAHQYLIEKEPKTWSRAFFQLNMACEAVENGFSECFNVVLLRVRNKPLLTMFEAIRVIVMERMNTMRKISERWVDDICPTVRRLEWSKDQQRFWHVIPAGGYEFEVRQGNEEFKVDESNVQSKLMLQSTNLWLQIVTLVYPRAKVTAVVTSCKVTILVRYRAQFFFEQLCATYDVEKYIHTPATKSSTTSLAPLTPEELKVDKIVLSWILFTLSDSLQARLVVARPKSAKEA
ncbi:hypothetical protein Tco_1103450 [Tanacetum coccineum]